MDMYIGIDVACAKDKYLPLVMCYWENERLIPLPLASSPIKPPKGLGNALTLHDEVNEAFAEDVAQCIEAICCGFKLNPVRIGIDSPLYPRDNNQPRRLAEQALDRAGISCYTTPSANDFVEIKAKGLAHLKQGKPIQNLPHSMQIFMLLGFALNKRLSQIAPCIEVYPHATVKRLGVANIHKSKGNQAEQQLAAIGQHTGWPQTEEDWQTVNTICRGPMHDKVDAYSATWVASLPEEKRIYFGEPDKNDAIWIPNVKPTEDTAIPLITKVTNSKAVQKPTNGDHQKLCPACGNHIFKRWPFGWDAHAAHKCTGLEEVDETARKAEFKRKFM